jgi:plasmid stabilization system protein ParE
MGYKLLKYAIVDDEIIHAIAYYESIAPSLGLRFEENVEKALDELETNPEYFFNLEDKKHRRIVIKGFPYAFIYSIENNTVIIKMLFLLVQSPITLWKRIS